MEQTKAAKRQHKYRHKMLPILKDQVYNMYGGYECACCGETEKMFLSLDHINNDGYKDKGRIRSSKGNYAKGTLDRLKAIIEAGFPPIYQVLCMNCNHGKYRNSGVCPHKTKQGVTTIPQGSTAKRPEAHYPEKSGDDIVYSNEKSLAV